MQRCSETIGAIASALAKAQAELENPQKTLTATIYSPWSGLLGKMISMRLPLVSGRTSPPRPNRSTAMRTAVAAWLPRHQTIRMARLEGARKNGEFREQNHCGPTSPHQRAIDSSPN